MSTLVFISSGCIKISLEAIENGVRLKRSPDASATNVENERKITHSAVGTNDSVSRDAFLPSAAFAIARARDIYVQRLPRTGEKAERNVPSAVRN